MTTLGAKTPARCDNREARGGRPQESEKVRAPAGQKDMSREGNSLAKTYPDPRTGGS